MTGVVAVLLQLEAAEKTEWNLLAQIKGHHVIEEPLVNPNPFGDNITQMMSQRHVPEQWQEIEEN